MKFVFLLPQLGLTLLFCFSFNQGISQNPNIVDLYHLDTNGEPFSIKKRRMPKVQDPLKQSRVTSVTDDILSDMSDNTHQGQDIFDRKNMLAIADYFDSNDCAPTIKYRGHLFFMDKNYKWGLKDANGKILIQPKFDRLKVSYEFKGGGFTAIENASDKYNFYDLTGEALFDQTYDYIAPYNDFFKVEIGDKYRILNKEGEVVIPWRALPEGLKPFSKFRIKSSNGKPYIITKLENGKMLLTLLSGEKNLELPFDYNSNFIILNDRYLLGNRIVADLQEQKYIATGGPYEVTSSRGWPNVFYLKKDRKYYYFDGSGDLKLDHPLSRVIRFSSPDAKFTSIRIDVGANDQRSSKPILKTGVINRNFEWVVAPKYRSAAVLSARKNLILVSNDRGRFGVVNFQGDVIVPLNYGFIRVYKDGFWAHAINRKYPEKITIYDYDGNNTGEYPVIYGYLEKRELRGNIFLTGRYYKKQREEVILNESFDVIYRDSTNSINGIFPFGPNGIIVKGQVLQQLSTKIVKYFDLEGNPYPFNIEGVRSGITPEFSILKQTDFLVVPTSTNGKKILYDLATDTSISLPRKASFLNAENYMPFNLIRYQVNGNLGFLTDKGEELVPPILDKISNVSRIRTIDIMKDGKYGVLSWTGEILFSGYDYVAHVSENLFIIERNGKRGIVNIQGHIIIPFLYQNISVAASPRSHLLKATDDQGAVTYYAINGEEVILDSK